MVIRDFQDRFAVKALLAGDAEDLHSVLKIPNHKTEITTLPYRTMRF